METYHYSDDIIEDNQKTYEFICNNCNKTLYFKDITSKYYCNVCGTMMNIVGTQQTNNLCSIWGVLKCV